MGLSFHHFGGWLTFGSLCFFIFSSQRVSNYFSLWWDRLSRRICCFCSKMSLQSTSKKRWNRIVFCSKHFLMHSSLGHWRSCHRDDQHLSQSSERIATTIRFQNNHSSCCSCNRCDTVMIHKYEFFVEVSFKNISTTQSRSVLLDISWKFTIAYSKKKYKKKLILCGLISLTSC